MQRSEAERPLSTAYGAYALGVLIVAYVLAFVDRQLLGLLVQPLKRDLGLSDVQLGLLQGLGFALFLALCGLPIGRRIDVARRIPLVSAGVAVWSLSTAACGLAPGFVVLLLCRMGIGAGEASLTPAVYSLIGDYLPARRLGLAVSLYGMGPYVGGGVALLLSGVILSHLPPGAPGGLRPWRVAFLLLGLPGLAVALWAATLREPRRRSAGRPVPGLGEAAAYFRGHLRTLAGVHLAAAFSAMALYALMGWAPAWLARSYHADAGRIGRSLGLEVMVFGALGSLAAGVIGDRLRRRGRAWRLGLMGGAVLLALPWAVAAPLAASTSAALACLAPLLFLATVAVSAGPAVLQEVTPDQMRGVQHALGVLTVNLLGLGLGPLLVALATDVVLRDEGKLWLSLAMLCPAMLLAAAVSALITLRPYAASHAQLEP